MVLGIRAQDEYRLDLQAAGITTRPVPALRAEGAARTAQWAHEQLADCAGYWVHIDVDVLDPAVMPAVDAPDPGGIAFAELEILLAGLVDTPHCLGVELTVFDPDYDPDGSYAAEIVNTVVSGLAPVSAPAAMPPRLLSATPAPPSPRRGNGRPAGLPTSAVTVEPVVPGPDDGPSDGSGSVRPPALGGPGLLRRVPEPEGETSDGAEPVGPPAPAGPGLLRRTGLSDEQPGSEAAELAGDLTSPRPGADIA